MHLWLQQCVVTFGLGLVAGATYLVVSTIIKTRRALNRYKQLNAGLPMLEGANPILANHGVEFLLGRNVPNKLTTWHEQYGDTFGFLCGTRFCASTIDLDLIKLIIHDEPQAHLNRMPLGTVMTEFEKDGIFLAEDEQWMRIRRAFGPALRKFKMPNIIGEIDVSIMNLVQSIKNKLNASEQPLEIELDDVVHRFSQDVVFRCLYKQGGLIDYDSARCQIVDIVDEAFRGPIDKSLPMRLCVVFPCLVPYLDKLVKRFTQVGQWQLTIMRFIEEQAKLALRARQHLRTKQTSQEANDHPVDADNFKLDDGTQFKRNIVDYIIDHYLDGKLTRQEFLNSSFLLFSAADKTVCDAITHAIYYLALDQDVQQKLRNSIIADGLDSEYLGWVLNESLRLHPPATIGCSRTISRDIKLKEGHTLPRGTYVHTPLYTIHRHRKIWGVDADKFVPDRWETAAGKLHPMQFIPFGAGRRSCPGKDLALFEMKSLLCGLLTRFKFETERRDDICTFDSPYTLYTLPSSRTHVRVSQVGRVNDS